ncbi:MAG: hypothetical protein LQ349_003828 [Xanthoria aureola]|nr:MAG: hypothetical protein LQ349_003828 [Xanthoria aureola]
MHHPFRSLWACMVLLLNFSIISFASPVLEKTNTPSLVPRVFEGWPVAESTAGGWRILLKQNMLLLPARDAIRDLEPFYTGVLQHVNHQIATGAPENALGFRYVEGFLKLAFRCATEDTHTCSWEAVKFFVEWQVDRLSRGHLSFCQGVLKGPGNQLIEFTFGTPSVNGIIRAASASDLNI